VIQSCTLAVAGGALGVWLTYASFDALLSLLPPQLPRLSNVSVDRWVLGFSVALSLTSGTALGLFSACHLTRGELQSTLQTYERATLPAQRLRLIVLATEVALAFVLLSGAAFWVSSDCSAWTLACSRNVLTLRLTLESYCPRSDNAFPGRGTGPHRNPAGVTSVAAAEVSR
jgi:hypothetical protein